MTSRTATVLVSDLVGSTELRVQLGEEAAEELRREHDRLLVEAVETHGGAVVKGLGDGVLALFDAASDALGAGVAVQQAVARHARRLGRPLRVRVGVSGGDVALEDGDCFGTPVIEAARLCAAAEGGEILVADLVRAMARGRGGHDLLPRGALQLKGLDDPVVAHSVAWPSEAGSDLTLPAGLAVSSPFGFVGRADELTVFNEAWKAARVGRRNVVLVAGELGVGKTRLAAEAAAAAQRDGAVVLFGRCDEDVALPYQPFVEALRSYVEAAPIDVLEEHVAQHGGALVRLVPELVRRVADAPPPGSSTDPETERYQLFEAAVALLAAAGRDAPLVMVLDDLHWASRPTALLLRHVARGTVTVPLLLVGTYRHTDLGDGHPLTDVLADLRREPAVQRLQLRGLSDDDAVAFAESAAGHDLDEAGVALAHAVHGETDGNPFFMGELYFHVAESGLVRNVAGRWVIADEVDHVHLPESVREVVGRRLRRLSEPAREVLRVAAVIGTVFDLRVLAEATAQPVDELLAAVDEAVAAALAVEVAGEPGRFRFANGVLRSTVYDELRAARRLHLHARVAAALETVRGMDGAAADLAHHWFRATPAAGAAADTAARAVEALRRAGRHAMASAAFEEAVGHHQRALEVLALLPDAGDGERIDALTELGVALFAAGEPSRDTLVAAARLARAAGDADRLVAAVLAASPGSWSSAPAGEVDVELVELLEAATGVVAPGTPEQAKVLASLAMEISYAGDLTRRRGLLDEALAVARRTGETSALVHVLARRMTIDPRSRAERMAESAELLGLTEELGDPVLAYIGAYARMAAMWAARDVAETDRLLAECGRLADQAGRPYLRWSVVYIATTRLITTGRLDEAEASADEYIRLGTSVGAGATASAAWAYHLFQIRMRQGRGIEQLLERQMAEAQSGPKLLGWGSQVPLMLCELDRTDEARAELERQAATGFGYLDDNPLAQHLLPALAGACSQVRAVEVAPALYERLLPYADELGTAMGGPNPEAPTAHHLGALAALMGRHDEAEDRFALALELERLVGDAYWEAQTRLEWARSHAARGEHDRARELAGAARDLATTRGFATLRRRADALLR